MSKNEEINKDYSYLHERLDPLGWTEERNVVVFPANVAGDSKEHRYELFDVNADGDLVINYYRVNGSKAEYRKGESKNVRHYQVLRYRVNRVKPDGSVMKYHHPSGTPTLPWFSPNIIEAFNAGRHIDTIYLQEGVIKCFAGYVHGLYMVGIPGIHNVKDKSTGTLHHDVIQLLKTCQPKQVVFLQDGDCRSLSRKWPEDPNVDLYEKPNSFFTSVRNLSELLKDYSRQVGFRNYYMHVVSDSISMPPKMESPKGFDDLLLAYPISKAYQEVQPAGPVIRKEEMDDADVAIEQAKQDLELVDLREKWAKRNATKCVTEIIQDITTFSAPNRFFERRDMDHVGKLREYFGLRNQEAFYAAHQERIGDKEFIYDGTKYQWSESDKELKIIRPSTADKFVRVGSDYFRYVKIPNPHTGKLEQTMRPWKKGEIIQDHGKYFIEHIPKYDSFINYPDHVAYREVINNCLNSYARFEHTPDPDADPPETTLGFLKHIFGTRDVEVPHPKPESEGQTIKVNELDLGLDYLKILYEKPVQILPILCLVSRERGTGKTTFFDYLQHLFSANCTFISAKDLEEQFNGHYASKKIIIIDEALISKQEPVEKIKAMSTQKSIMVNNKSVAQYPQAFFGVFLMGSNNIKNFIKTDDDEVRWWVRKVPKIPDSMLDVDLFKKLVDETGAFLHYLSNRPMATEKLHRAWFHPPLLVTEALEDVRRHSMPAMRRAIMDWFKDVFLAMPHQQEIYMSVKYVNKEIFKGNRNDERFIREQLEELGLDVLRDLKGKSITKTYSYWRIGEKKDGDHLESYLQEVKVTSADRPFVFKRSVFVDPNDDEPPVTDPKPAPPDTGNGGDDDDDTPF